MISFQKISILKFFQNFKKIDFLTGYHTTICNKATSMSFKDMTMTEKSKVIYFYQRIQWCTFHNRARTLVRGNRAPTQGLTNFFEICICMGLLKSHVARAEVRAQFFRYKIWIHMTFEMLFDCLVIVIVWKAKKLVSCEYYAFSKIFNFNFFQNFKKNDFLTGYHTTICNEATSMSFKDMTMTK